MKKLIFILLLLFIILGGFFYYFNFSETSQDNQIENTETIQSQEPEEPVIPDDQLIPYTDLPEYNYSTQEILLSNENQRIYGECLIPDSLTQKVPLVVCCHGLGANLYSVSDYAEIFAQKGLASFIFDFRGGGGNQSEGESTDMSVLTEVSDLEVVLSNAINWDFVDPTKIILFGESQGGLVAAITAARHPDEIAGLVLEYPAFVIDDTIRSFEINQDEMPESFTFGNLTLGKRYVLDMIDFDSYEEIVDYNKRVLILQGDQDTIVPEEYSKRASETYSNAEYYVIDGAGHRFNNEEFNISLDYIFNYLERIGIIQI